MIEVRIALIAVAVAACSGSERHATKAPVAPLSFDAAPADARPPPDAALAPPPELSDAAPWPISTGRPPPKQAPEQVVEVPPRTADNRCTVDADCHLFHEDCGSICGICPGGGEAVNRAGLRKAERACARERRAWKKKHPRRPRGVRCSPCRERYSTVSCEYGTCVRIDHDGRRSGDPLEGLDGI